MKKKLFVQYLNSLLLLTFGAVFTGISVFSFGASHLKKSEYREIDKTSKTIVQSMERNVSETGNINEAISAFQGFLDINADMFHTNYYILDGKSGEIIISSKSVYKEYKPKSISTLKGSDKFSIVNSETIIYSKSMQSSLSESGTIQFIAIRSADELYKSIMNIGEILIVSATVVLIIFAVIFHFIKQKRYKLLVEINEKSEAYLKNTNNKLQLPDTNDYEIRLLVSIINRMADVISDDKRKSLEFMSNISHEIKTPITIINGFISGILDGTIPKNDTRKYLARISEQTNRMIRLVKTMMKISGIESGEMQLNGKPVNLTALFVETLFMYEKEIEEKDVVVDGIDSARAIMFGDKDMLYQIVYNLVDNAVKFVNHGGKIKLNAYSDEQNIYIRFGNTGMGISGKDMPRIFDRFYKTDFSRSSDTSGVGLGLSIVKKFVSYHRGSIVLKSTPDDYTEFLLTFPAYKPEMENQEDNKENGNINAGQ
ncbi:sensor histidine kinase [Porcipelethomonas sp.]|uniref:sensor histidine kinase n=1 Tax=Porcipelethomonas sp. TaxID=2981675 RepID=UPI003EF253B9